MNQKFFFFLILIFLIIFQFTLEEECQKIQCSSNLPQGTCIKVLSSVSMLQECPSGQRCSPDFDDPIFDAQCTDYKENNFKRLPSLSCEKNEDCLSNICSNGYCLGKMFGEKYPTIESERKKGQKIKIKEPKIKVDQIKGSKDGRHGESSQESKKYGQIRKEGENITEKIFPGQNNTLINEKRKVEIFKLNQPKSKQDIRVSSKESGRHTGSMDSKKYTSIRKEGEKITDKIYPGQNDTIINERRKVEVFKIQKSKTKQDFRIDSRDKRKYDEGLSDSKEIIDTTVKRRTKIIDGSHTSEDSSLISGRKGDIQLFKKTKTKAELEKLGKEAGKYTEISKKETDFSQIEKQGEKS